MPRIRYVNRKFSSSSAAIIASAISIIDEYTAAGYQLTLRQLYYQFVSRDLIPNKQSEYKRLGSIINDARLAGLIDWDAIEDRGRNLQKFSSWATPADIVASAAQSYAVDMWENQPAYVEVWVEKEALLGVVATACDPWRVPHFACKGYTSQSEMWDAGHNRIYGNAAGRDVLIVHLGDHDPSGIDMTRDIEDRLSLFARTRVSVNRIALNLAQIQRYNPPPNPAKQTDSRFAEYEAQFGDESWELDALDPSVIVKLITDEIEAVVDTNTWDEDRQREQEGRNKLTMISDYYEEVVRNLDVIHG